MGLLPDDKAKVGELLGRLWKMKETGVIDVEAVEELHHMFPAIVSHIQQVEDERDRAISRAEEIANKYAMSEARNGALESATAKDDSNSDPSTPE